MRSLRCIALVALLPAAGCKQILEIDDPVVSSDGALPGGDGANGDGGNCAGKVVGTTCYERMNAMVDWNGARSGCGSAAHLAIVRDAATQQALGSLLNLSENGWIGGTDQMTEGTFLWIDGSAVMFTAWLFSQPDNQNNSDCILTANDGQLGWDDAVCTELHHYFCERPAT
jgi:hypothetical protein